MGLVLSAARPRSLPPMADATQHALRCQDILTEIFKHLSPGWLDEWKRDPQCAQDQKTQRQALASAARVCRAFSDPALDVLWRALDDVQPVLWLFPTFVRSGRVISQVCVHVKFLAHY